MELTETAKRVNAQHGSAVVVRWGTQHILRLLTGKMRVLPDFIIIGAQRCGTTSLFRYLVEQPGVFPSFPKEVHFFSNHFHKGVPWYRSHFPLNWQKRYVEQILKRHFLTGEATPYYIAHPHAPRRISRTVPAAKLIVLLRNPVDRAYSHYHFEVKNGIETLSFEEAIDREEDRLLGEREKMFEDETYRSFGHQHFSYLSRGIYVDQLEVWAKYFDREQIHVLSSEDLLNDPAKTVMEAGRFLGMSGRSLDRYKKYNYVRYARMDQDIRRRLIDYFKPHNKRLYEHLGVDLGWER